MAPAGWLDSASRVAMCGLPAGPAPAVVYSITVPADAAGTVTFTVPVPSERRYRPPERIRWEGYDEASPWPAHAFGGPSYRERVP